MSDYNFKDVIMMMYVVIDIDIWDVSNMKRNDS